MKPKFEVEPKIGIGPIKLGMNRELAIESMGLKPESFMKTPMSQHPTDAYYEYGFQIFYEGKLPKVQSIELSRGCSFDATFSGENILELPVFEALKKVETITGIKPQTLDDGYTYVIPSLGVWLWRESNEENEEEGIYFSTIGVGSVNT
jgi:hypothetical protein